MDRAAKIVFCFARREQITLLVASPSCNTSIYNVSCAFWYQIWWLAGGGPWSEQLSVSVVFCHEYYYYLILARPHCYWFGFNTIAGFLWGERERERERLHSPDWCGQCVPADKELPHHIVPGHLSHRHLNCQRGDGKHFWCDRKSTQYKNYPGPCSCSGFDIWVENSAQVTIISHSPTFLAFEQNIFLQIWG